MRKVYLLGACRTAIGKMGASLSTVPALELGATVIKEVVRRAEISTNDVDHVFVSSQVK